MNRFPRWATAGIALGALACSSSDGPTEVTPPPTFRLALQAIDTIGSTVYVTAPAGDSRLFVVVQDGTIRIIKNGTLLTTPFLDLHTIVHRDAEEGLLSMAFHPSFASNGYFYVYYTDANHNITIQRYHATPTSDVADAGSAQELLTFPYGIGNFGGLLMFGPDGKLYAGVGDGGGANLTGQDSSTYLGKILRMDVDAGNPYAVPSNNPYAGSGHGFAKPEIWAKGVRNPWRYSFDNTTNRFYLGDVGESRIEEVDVVPSTQAGVNFGWSIMEGDACFPSAPCNEAGLTLPVLTYSHDSGHCAVIGGFVYRGSVLPEITGHYFYSDVCGGGLNSFRYTTDSAAVDKISWDVGTTGGVQSFGRDGSGELYLINTDGIISKIIRKPATN